MTDAMADSGPDQGFQLNLLLELAQEKSVEQLLQKLVQRVVEERPAVARFRIWMIEKGDLCATCPRRRECPDQTRCLHAVMSGRSAPDGSGVQMEHAGDHFARIPLGVGCVGQIAVTGKQRVLEDLDKNPGDLASIPWVASEHIKGFNGVPIVYKGEILGVGVLFSRSHFPAVAIEWSRAFANHIAAAIANARAFEEIQRLKTRLEQQNAYLQEEVVEAKAFGDLVGQSAALRQVVSQIDLVAPTDASVLILGETGTGKELVAHEIHRRSRRREKPLIRVNCASIPRELFESEFFGHARGAFTGAVRDRAGRFEAAEGGTLFLDEIGEVPFELQGKLLRVLQEKKYERVGEDRTRQADVRIIGATNRDLKKEVTAGRFREDLYYRLNVFPIHVAPLRERREDIPLLAQHFVGVSVRELRCLKPRFTRANSVPLQNYNWPGNIRELRNVIERAVILARGGILEFDLPDVALTAIPSSRQRTVGSPLEPRGAGESPNGFLTELEMQRRERENLLAVLEKSGWRVKGAGGAAELLGVKPTTLMSRIHKMKLEQRGQPGRAELPEEKP